MIFRNNNNRVSIINRLDFSNDREYYKHVRDFMNTKQSENLSHLREKKRLVSEIIHILRN